MKSVKESVKIPMALSEELLHHAELVAQVFLQAMYTSIGERLLEELAESDLTYSQMQALRYIRTHRRVTVGDLAEGLNISYPSATNMVHRLEKKGFIRRVANPRDRRQVGLMLTAEGSQLIERVDTERRMRFARVLAQMGQDERHAFIKGLSAFIRAGVGANILNAFDVCLHCGTDADPQCPLVELHSPEICR